MLLHKTYALPPLRQRPEDVEPLLDYFLARCAERDGRPAIHVPDHIRRRLSEFPWPGNVRQLTSWVEGLYATGAPVEALAEGLFEQEQARCTVSPERMPGVSLVEAERLAIVRAMQASEQNLPRAAAMLQIHRTTLWRKLRTHRLP